MSRKDKTVSIALSEKRCCPPLFFDVRGFQDLMTDGDIQRVKEPRLQRDCLRFLPVCDLIFLLILWVTASFMQFLHDIPLLNGECNLNLLFMHQRRTVL